ncbi:4-pyridoxate dehydrogenase-like [Rhipicephalus sanguineus]|uniref:4-pyridoxate dehydrogenase-like n=1 Tax=Rhipicephalus sanguineus TaxID=34632 RepID=UPI00189397B7|nr:4-pyridoxate dehydrogenase-like [Rhipicephalus sanguineus]
MYVNATTCAPPWLLGSLEPQSELGLMLALGNLLVHAPFNRLPVVRDYELGKLRQRYDYVIVGGGSAGCVVANRLSADPKVTVRLLEAGGLETAAIQVPALVAFNIRGHDDWDYWSVPLKNAAFSYREQVCA